jgi:hypothetical protein
LRAMVRKIICELTGGTPVPLGAMPERGMGVSPMVREWVASSTLHLIGLYIANQPLAGFRSAGAPPSERSTPSRLVTLSSQK